MLVLKQWHYIGFVCVEFALFCYYVLGLFGTMPHFLDTMVVVMFLMSGEIYFYVVMNLSAFGDLYMVCTLYIYYCGPIDVMLQLES